MDTFHAVLPEHISQDFQITDLSYQTNKHFVLILISFNRAIKNYRPSNHKTAGNTSVNGAMLITINRVIR